MKIKSFVIIMTVIFVAILILVLFTLFKTSSSPLNSASIKADFAALTNKENLCASIGMEDSSPDSTNDARCFSRPFGYILLKKINTNEYQCTDTLGSSLNIKLDFSKVPEYCDNSKAVHVLLTELASSTQELQKLVKSNDTSVENQQKFRALVINHQGLLDYALKLNPFDSNVTKVTNEFYNLLSSTGVQGASQKEVDERIKKAQESFGTNPSH